MDTLTDATLEPNNNCRAGADSRNSWIGSSEFPFPLGAGQSYGGLEICPEGDVDYYGIDLVAGDRVRFVLQLTNAMSPTQKYGDLDCAVLDPTFNIVAVGATWTEFEDVQFTASMPGRYYFVVQGAVYQTGTGTNTYAFTVDKNGGS
jgi:hypothetical protein